MESGSSNAATRHAMRVKMVENERRKNSRKKSLNLVDYVLLDDEGRPISRGMGRTRNVGEAGLLLETRTALEVGQRVLITVGLEDYMVELKGRVVYTTPSDDKGYRAGIEFFEIDQAAREVLRPYIVAIETGAED